MALPDQLLLSDLLRFRVRCDRGLDHGPGVMGWMHPPVHRLLGWVSRPSGFGRRRLVWRLDQLRDLSEQELLVVGDPAETDPDILERLPTLLEAALLGQGDRPLGTLADAAVDLRSGRIQHYLVSRSDPRLPGSSRWRLSPDRILDQQPGRVFTALRELDDLPLARASVRQALLQRSRRWRQQVEEETSRLRDQVQQVGDRWEERVEGWLEERPWEPADADAERGPRGASESPSWPDPEDDPLENWRDPDAEPPATSPQRRPRARSAVDRDSFDRGAMDHGAFDRDAVDRGEVDRGQRDRSERNRSERNRSERDSSEGSGGESSRREVDREDRDRAAFRRSGFDRHGVDRPFRPRPGERDGQDRYRGRDGDDDPWI